MKSEVRVGGARGLRPGFKFWPFDRTRFIIWVSQPDFLPEAQDKVEGKSLMPARSALRKDGVKKLVKLLVL